MFKSRKGPVSYPIEHITSNVNDDLSVMNACPSLKPGIHTVEINAESVAKEFPNGKADIRMERICSGGIADIPD